MSSRVATSIPIHIDRSVNPKIAGDIALMLEGSGVVDYFQTYDQLTNLLPRALWRPDVTALAEATPDCDSFANGFLLGAFAMAKTSTLGLSMTTDAIRMGPAELAQIALTLANSSGGDTLLMLGAGELKQCKPYGYKRSEGLDRLEDHLKLFRLLTEADDLIDFQGKVWNYQGAWIGGVHPKVPKLWAMGGGPRLLDLATRYADGLATAVPCAFPNPEAFGAQVTKVKQQLEQQGRDPEAFGFGIWVPTFIHDDPAEIERAYENALVRWWAAAFGRFHHGDWAKEGVPLVLPENFHYALKAIPAQMTREELEAIIDPVSRAMLEKSLYVGSSKDVADAIGDYIDAGATQVSLWDFGPMTCTPDQVPEAIGRAVEVCGHLKNR